MLYYLNEYLSIGLFDLDLYSGTNNEFIIILYLLRLIINASIFRYQNVISHDHMRQES